MINEHKNKEQGMSSIIEIATRIAGNFDSLDELDLEELHSDEGMNVDGVTVWHREDDDMIVVFRSIDGLTEDWAKARVPRVDRIGARVRPAIDPDFPDAADTDRIGTVTGGEGEFLAVRWDDGGWTTHHIDRLTQA